MNYQIIADSENISHLVVSYSRTHAICDGIGRISLVVSNSANLQLWKQLVVYENAKKVGTYYISSITYKESTGELAAEAQDGSKKLSDYFLDDITTPTNVIKYSRELLIDILSRAGVSYSFSVSGNGAPVAPETQLGTQSAYDAVLLLCQQSGWYFYFDENNICRIGKLKASLSNVKFTFSDSNVLEFSYSYNDNSLRNKAIVWGGYDSSSKKPVLFSKRVYTPWDRHKKDIRSVVLSNGAIHSLKVAKYLGNLLLATFSKLNKEKKLVAPGFTGLTIGDVVRLNLTYHKSTSIITDIEVNVSSAGVKTTLTLDKRCPRLFAWFDWGTNPNYNDYVYVGTQGGGVKRKYIGGTGWYDFSSGLGNLTVKDLRIYAGNFICVADDGYAYIRSEGTNWSKLRPGSFSDGINEYTEEEVKAISCSIDQVTGDYFVGYNYYELDTDFHTFRSWVVQFDSSGKVKNKFPVSLYFTNRVLIHDLDRHSANTFIAGIGDISDFLKVGERNTYPIKAPEETLPFIFGPQLLTTSGGVVEDKHQDNYLYSSSGVLVYSGAFLSGLARDVCSYIKSFDWISTHSLYDNGRIFTLSFHGGYGLSIYDFTPSGVTTLTGLPIRHPNLISGMIPPFGYNNRFLHLEKKADHPELHYITIDTYGQGQRPTSSDGNKIFHGKYIFTDYSYTTLSGTEIIKNREIFVDEPQNLGHFNFCFRGQGGLYNQDVLCDNGVILAPFWAEYGNHLGLFLVRYNVETQEKRIVKVLEESSLYDVHCLYVSPPIKIPYASAAVIGANFWVLDKKSIIDGQCRILSNVPIISSYLIFVALGNKVFNDDNYEQIEATPPVDFNEFCFVKRVYWAKVESDGACSNPESGGNGLIVWLLGSELPTGNNNIICRGHVLDEKGTTIIDAYIEFNYQSFYYKPWVPNPCCYDPEESVYPTWISRRAGGFVRLNVNKDGFIIPLLTKSSIADSPAPLISVPLVAPSGYLPSYIGAHRLSRGYNFYIGKIDPLTGDEVQIPIPVFYEWDLGSVLPHVCPYIDFFDNTIYVFTSCWGGGNLYGIDYNTGILKKFITGFYFEMAFGEKCESAPPVIHNGILFRRSAFWVFRTTVTGYFVFPVLYQNYFGTTNLVNVELLPINVEVSKVYPYITYNPFEYWLPSVSGSLVPFSGGLGTKIYTIDFSAFSYTSLTGNDERIVDIMEIPYIASGIVESGIIDIENMRYIAIPVNKSLYIQDIDLNTSPAVLKYSNNLIYHVETSNIPPTPFVFMNDLSTFYEFDKEIWRTCPNPSAKILTIRVDDLL
jgi:hypothetical protein